MTFTLALLQAGPIENNSLYLILGIVILFTLVALGLKFWRNMFEVITAPAASLGYHGQHDNFFFSLVIVFLGGVIGTFILVSNQAEMVQGYHSWASTVAAEAAAGGANPTYEDVAHQWGTDKLNAAFSNYVISNLVFYPVVMVLVWIFIGLIAFVAAKLFGANTTLGIMLGSLAYPYFFLAIGWAASNAVALGSFGDVMAMASGGGGGMAFAGMNLVWMIVGAVLSIYGLILWFMAVAQGGQLMAGGVVGVTVVVLIVVGGIEALFYYQGLQPALDNIMATVRSIDPAKPDFQMPE